MPRTKSDPLLAALIKKLPLGNNWPVDQQLAWLKMMAMAFGTIYGGNVLAMLEGKPAPFKPFVVGPYPEIVGPSFPFYVDTDNYARRKGGDRVLAKDVKGTLYDLRGEDGDLAAIIWADDTTGIEKAGRITISGGQYA